MADIETMESVRKGLTALSAGINAAQGTKVHGKTLVDGAKEDNDGKVVQGATGVASTVVSTVGAATGKNIPYVGQALASETFQKDALDTVKMAKGEITLRDTGSDGHTLTAMREGISDNVATAGSVFLSSTYTKGLVNADYGKKKISPVLQDSLRHPAGQVLGLAEGAVDVVQDAVNIGHGNIWSEKGHEILTGKEGALSPFLQKFYNKADEIHLKVFKGKFRENSKPISYFNDFCDKVKSGIHKADDTLYDKLGYKKRDEQANKHLDRINDCLGQLYVDKVTKQKDNEVTIQPT